MHTMLSSIMFCLVMIGWYQVDLLKIRETRSTTNFTSFVHEALGSMLEELVRMNIGIDCSKDVDCASKELFCRNRTCACVQPKKYPIICKSVDQSLTPHCYNDRQCKAIKNDDQYVCKDGFCFREVKETKVETETKDVRKDGDDDEEKATFNIIQLPKMSKSTIVIVSIVVTVIIVSVLIFCMKFLDYKCGNNTAYIDQLEEQKLRRRRDEERLKQFNSADDYRTTYDEYGIPMAEYSNRLSPPSYDQAIKPTAPPIDQYRKV